MNKLTLIKSAWEKCQTQNGFIHTRLYASSPGKDSTVIPRWLNSKPGGNTWLTFKYAGTFVLRNKNSHRILLQWYQSYQDETSSLWRRVGEANNDPTFDALTLTTTDITILRNMTPYSLLQIYTRFRRTSNLCTEQPKCLVTPAAMQATPPNSFSSAVSVNGSMRYTRHHTTEQRTVINVYRHQRPHIRTRCATPSSNASAELPLQNRHFLR